MSEIIRTKLMPREAQLLSYALQGGAAFCQHGEDVKLFSIPLFDDSGQRSGTERIIARFCGESPAHTVSEQLWAEKEVGK